MSEHWVKGKIPCRGFSTITDFVNGTQKIEARTVMVNGIIFGYFGIHRPISRVTDKRVTTTRSGYVITHIPSGMSAGAHRTQEQLQRYAEMAMATPEIQKQISSKSVRVASKALRPVMKKWKATF